MDTQNDISLNLTGGKIIASGGFGCIFNPALKCDNSISRNSNKISKLMAKVHATDEYNLIQQFKTTLNKIPNYNNYFLLDDFTLCQPAKLTTEDLINFNKKCKPMKKKGINSKNINKSLNKMLTLNMPNGGIDVEKFASKYFDVPQNIVRLNNSLIDLLVNGIQPMNRLNVFHCDVKNTNILVKTNETGLTTRLIDWGMSVLHNSPEELPRKLYRRPFQYNVPFSSILFNKEFVKMYNNYLITSNNNPNYEIREFIINYIFVWNDQRGSGHLNAINKNIELFTINELEHIKQTNIKKHMTEYGFTYYYIVNYLTKILQKYTIQGKFKMMDYFNDVFLKNIDVWGFTMVYITLYKNLLGFYNEDKKHFIKKLKYIIIHFLFETPTEVINVNSLATELTNLNQIFNELKPKYYSGVGGTEMNKTKKNKTKKNKTKKNKTH